MSNVFLILLLARYPNVPGGVVRLLYETAAIPVVDDHLEIPHPGPRSVLFRVEAIERRRGWNRSVVQKDGRFELLEGEYLAIVHAVHDREATLERDRAALEVLFDLPGS